MSAPGTKVVIATSLAALSALVINASAASLGGVTVADLFAWSAPVTIAVPSAIALDEFVCSGNLQGQTDSLGNTWTDHGGDWQCLGSGEVRARQRVPLGHATVDLGVSDQVTLSSFISSISTQAGRSGPGVSFLSDGLSHLYVTYRRDQGLITFGKREVALDTVIATAAVPDRATVEIRVEIAQPQIRVLVDGVTVITHTMTMTETLIFGSNSRFGLEADNDNQSRFDRFRAERS